MYDKTNPSQKHCLQLSAAREFVLPPPCPLLRLTTSTTWFICFFDQRNMCNFTCCQMLIDPGEWDVKATSSGGCGSVTFKERVLLGTSL